MALDDPKKRMAAADTDEVDDLRDQIDDLKNMVAALAKQQVSSGGITPELLEAMFVRVARVQADAAERAANPSNKTHPGISVYSYPEGDRARPRALKCPMFWVGYDIQPDTTTAYEIELLNKAVPGTFAFLCTDGSQEQLTCIGTAAPNGSISKLLFDFPTKENRESLPSMASMLQQAYGIKSPEQVELDRLRAEVEALRSAKTLTAA